MGCGTFLGWVLKNITTSKNQHTQRKLFREILMILKREIIWHFLTYCHWLYHWLYSKNMDCNFHKFPLITYVQPKILLFRNHCQFFFIKWFSKSFHDKNHSPRIFPSPELKISQLCLLQVWLKWLVPHNIWHHCWGISKSQVCLFFYLSVLTNSFSSNSLNRFRERQ